MAKNTKKKSGRVQSGKSSGSGRGHLSRESQRDDASQTESPALSMPGAEPRNGRRGRGRDESQEDVGVTRRLISRSADGLRYAGERVVDAGSATVESARLHPVYASLIGAGIAAGIAVLATQAISPPPKHRGKKGRKRREEEAEEGLLGRVGHDLAEGAEEVWETVRDGTVRATEYAEEGIEYIGESLRDGALAVRKSARRTYGAGRDSIEALWDNHPLAVSAGVFAIGLAAGLFLPATRPERLLLSGPTGRLARRVRTTGRELLDRSREVAGLVVSETGEAVREEVERAGLNPEKLAKKAKRVAERVKEAVTTTAAGE